LEFSGIAKVVSEYWEVFWWDQVQVSGPEYISWPLTGRPRELLTVQLWYSSIEWDRKSWFRAPANTLFPLKIH
jgi:hypothetical protein